LVTSVVEHVTDTLLQLSVAVIDTKQCGMLDRTGLQPMFVLAGQFTNTGGVVSSIQVTTWVQVLVWLHPSTAV
jgi:hypothetical protein